MSRAADHLDERLSVLDKVVQLAGNRLPDELVARSGAAATAARGRLGAGTGHTVVALAGATGSGKSSLFNSLAGTTLAATGVRRPTTSTAQAAVFSAGDAAEATRLLDWLGVPQRHVLPSEDLAGLILLDLPDHDSTAESHRTEVDRLVQVVDTFVWVVDPQKYADAALHEGYLRRFAGHGAVTLVAMNQIDRIPPESRRAFMEHLGRLLADDGLSGVRTLAVSATTGEGIEPLRRELGARAADRRAAVTRLEADLDWLADDLTLACGDATPSPVDRSQKERLADAFVEAAGVDGVADAVARAHRYRAAGVTGWPPTRWVKKLKPDPLRRLGLDRRPRPSDRPPAVDDPVIPRTSREGGSLVAEAGVSDGVRRLVAEVSDGLTESLRASLVRAATDDLDQVGDRLDEAIGRTELPTSRPHHWRLLSGLQWLATAVMAAGLIWLAVLVVLAWLKVPDPPTPEWHGWPLPTLFAAGGAAVGLLIALCGRVSAAVGSRRRAEVARRRLRESAESVAREMVIQPLDAEIAAVNSLAAGVRTLAR